MEIKGYEFLKEHQYYVRTKEFSEHNICTFHRPLEGGGHRTATLQLPTKTEGTFNWFFSNEEVEPWFQELIEKAERKAEELFRIKRVFENKM